MGVILDAAEVAWSGKGDGAAHIWRAQREIEEVAERTWFYSGFANMVVRETTDGLLIIDPGAFNNAEAKFETVRGVLKDRVHTILYTHGHVDHCFGADLYVAEAEQRGWARPQVVAHEAVTARFERYRATEGYNGIVNLRQFRGGKGRAFWPTEYQTPDVTYREGLTLQIGDVGVELRHARGETDDATWAYFPDTRVLCTGDLFVWVAPNAGNPQKVQRYAAEWAAALREMASLDAELLLPGHGPPIVGGERVRQALEDTARYLQSLHDDTLALMNEGATLDAIVQRVQPPEELAARPYLQAVYDEPDFVVRNVWRLYGGWYDGIPSHLKPATEREQAEAIAELAGGVGDVAAKAEAALDGGDLRLACHLADWAHFAAPEDDAIREVRREVYRARSERERSTMAIGLYRSVAVEMGDEIEGSTLGG